jgi:hypothetical protein
VVLTPRRWRQVGGGDSANDGGKRARSPGRARRKPLKPLRGECRAFSGVTVVTNARAFYTTRAAAGASGARHSLRPLIGEGGMFSQNSRGLRGEIAKLWLLLLKIRILVVPPGCHRPTRSGDPVFQRHQRLSREAAAYWIPRMRGV